MWPRFLEEEYVPKCFMSKSLNNILSSSFSVYKDKNWGYISEFKRIEALTVNCYAGSSLNTNLEIKMSLTNEYPNWYKPG